MVDDSRFPLVSKLRLGNRIPSKFYLAIKEEAELPKRAFPKLELGNEMDGF